MKSRLPIFLSLLGLIGGSLAYFAFSDYVIQKAEPNEIEGSVATTNEPVCYIGEQEFTTLDRALEYAYEDDAANDIYVYVGQNPSIDEEHTIASNDALYITYCDVKGESGSSFLKNEELGIRKWGSGTSTNDISGFSCSSKVTLNADLKVEGQIKIGAVVSTSSLPYQGFIQGEYAALDINGHTLTIKDGGIVYANGVLDDSASAKGEVDVESGGKIYTDFGVEDFHGGTCTQNKYYNDETPFLLYKLPYLLATTKINYGGGLYGNCVLYALSSFNFIEEPLIAPSGLIEPQSGYVTHANEDSSIDGYKERIDIYGDIKTNALTMSYSFVSISIANVHFPISKYLDFNAYGDSVMSIGTKLKVLPGSAINLYGSSSLNVGAEVSLYQTFKAQSEFSSYSNYTFYPDYGTYDPAYIKLNGASSLAIDSSVSAGLSGRIIFDTSDACLEELASDIKTSSDVAYSITTSEGIGYPSYVKLYDYINYLDVYQVDGSVAKCLYKRFSNYYFEYLYDSDNSTVLTEIDMKTLKGTTIAKKENINASEEAMWQILTPELEFITSDETADYIDSAITINATDTNGDTTTSLYIYDGEYEYFYTSSNKIIISYGSNNVIVTAYDESRGIYTDGSGFYIKINETWALFDLLEDANVITNTDGLYSKRSYIYEEGEWTQVTYSSDYHYIVCEDEKYYIFYDGSKKEIDSSSNIIDMDATSMLTTLLYAVDAEGNNYVYYNACFCLVDTIDKNNFICTINGETYIYYAFKEVIGAYKYIKCSAIYKSYCYAQTDDTFISSKSIEYSYVFLCEGEDGTRRWHYGRPISDEKLNYVEILRLETSGTVNKAIPVTNAAGDGFFLWNSTSNVYDSYEDDEQRIIYSADVDDVTTTGADKITDCYEFLSKNENAQIEIASVYLDVFDFDTSLFLKNDDGKYLKVTKSDVYGGYFDENGYMYGFYRTKLYGYDTLKGKAANLLASKIKFNLKFQEHESYEGLFYGTFEVSSTTYLCYAALLSEEEASDLHSSNFRDACYCCYSTETDIDSLIVESTDEDGNKSYSIKFYYLTSKSTSHSLVRKE